jgi:hypothetical protein
MAAGDCIYHENASECPCTFVLYALSRHSCFLYVLVRGDRVSIARFVVVVVVGWLVGWLVDCCHRQIGSLLIDSHLCVCPASSTIWRSF